MTPNEKGYKGFIAKSQPLSPTIMKNVTDSGQIYKDRIADLYQIVNVCKNNQIKLIIFFPPTYNHFTKTTGTIKAVMELPTTAILEEDSDDLCIFKLGSVTLNKTVEFA